MHKKTFAEVTEMVIKFRDERNWKQFHNPKDCAISLALEAAEVLEHFQWKDDREQLAHIEAEREAVADELADVCNLVLLMSHDFGIDIADAIEHKLRKNNEKYPIEKAHSKKIKYTKLA